jgi:hypothetical protein
VIRECRELINLVVKINDEGKHHAFMEISPHCDLMAFRVYKNGWMSSTHADEYFDCYYKGYLCNRRKITSCRDRLEKYLKINADALIAADKLYQDSLEGVKAAPDNF